MLAGIDVLATDLLIGVGIGIGVKLLLHVRHGVPLASLFVPRLDVREQDAATSLVTTGEAAVFCNWLLVKRRLVGLGIHDHNNVILDLSRTRLVDHSVMEKLHELERTFLQHGVVLEIIGLDHHRPLSDHPHAARKKLTLTASAPNP